MHIRSKGLSALWKAILFAAAALGVLIQCGAFSGVWNLTILNYYTLLSNVLCAVYFPIAAISVASTGRTPLRQWKGALTMGITVTGLVYHFMLSGAFSMQGTISVSNLLLHYIVPIMAVLDWLLFDEKGRYTRYSPLLWVILPNLYFVYILIRAELGGHIFNGARYPYPFINIDVLGWGKVYLTVLLMNLFFLALGYVFVGIDHLLRKRKKSRR